MYLRTVRFGRSRRWCIRTVDGNTTVGPVVVGTLYNTYNTIHTYVYIVTSVNAANSMAAMSSDTMSEVSDSTSRSYSDSREEMHQFAISLGLESADDLAKERFKIDRKKLESMLHCKCVSISYTPFDIKYNNLYIKKISDFISGIRVSYVLYTRFKCEKNI